jgi:hypothetical protein
LAAQPHWPLCFLRLLRSKTHRARLGPPLLAEFSRIRLRSEVFDGASDPLCRHVDLVGRSQPTLHGPLIPSERVSGMLADDLGAVFRERQDIGERILAEGRQGVAAARARAADRPASETPTRALPLPSRRRQDFPLSRRRGAEASHAGPHQKHGCRRRRAGERSVRSHSAGLLHGSNLERPGIPFVVHNGGLFQVPPCQPVETVLRRPGSRPPGNGRTRRARPAHSYAVEAYRHSSYQTSSVCSPSTS